MVFAEVLIFPQCYNPQSIDNTEVDAERPGSSALYTYMNTVKGKTRMAKGINKKLHEH
jgi:hypothetical protein